MRVTQARVLRSEWTKFRSLRSTVWTLLAAVVLAVGVGALLSAVTASQYDTFTGRDRRASTRSHQPGRVRFAQLALGVLGVLLISGEYSTGMIRSSLTVVPKRLPVLWGKLAVFAGAVSSSPAGPSFVSFFLGQALLSGQHIERRVTTRARCGRSSAPRCTSPSPG